jgi:hypothetical protein
MVRAETKILKALKHRIATSMKKVLEQESSNSGRRSQK